MASQSDATPLRYLYDNLFQPIFQHPTELMRKFVAAH